MKATRTGAPLVLLHFLRWLRAKPDVDFENLLRGLREVAIVWRLRLSLWGRLKKRLKLYRYFKRASPSGVRLE